MDKIERIVDSDSLGINEIRRIKGFSKEEVFLTLSAITIPVIVGAGVYLICHEGIIKPVIEYFLK